jgi:Immunoglobulin I-set domain
VQIKRRKVEVKETEKIEFTCEVSGNPMPIVQWTKNHNLLTSSSHIQVLTKRYGLLFTD